MIYFKKWDQEVYSVYKDRKEAKVRHLWVADTGLEATSESFQRFASGAQCGCGSTQFSLINFNKSAPADLIHFILWAADATVEP